MDNSVSYLANTKGSIATTTVNYVAEELEEDLSYLTINNKEVENINITNSVDYSKNSSSNCSNNSSINIISTNSVAYDKTSSSNSSSNSSINIIKGPTNNRPNFSSVNNKASFGSNNGSDININKQTRLDPRLKNLNNNNN